MKITKQKEAILTTVQSMRNHPTAGEIYDKLRGSLRHISLGTVYRNLNFFVQKGEISKLSIPDSGDRFDYRLEPHNHLICKKCSLVFDTDTEVEIALKECGVTMESYTLFIHGVCSKCNLQVSA